MTYARNTDVSPEQTKAEIERTLRRYGADQFMYGYDRQQGIVGFRAFGRSVRFLVPLPDPKEERFLYTPARRYERSAKQQAEAYEQEAKRIWRALLLAIKAKLEVVESGIATFEEEFMSYIVLPDNTTVGQWMTPQIAKAYEEGLMPSLLPALGTGSE